ncbi:MAG: ATP-binding protein [Rhodobacteraceae bacterium]|nr:ATP-binding protein [Paracoccaceae bacterium]
MMLKRKIYNNLLQWKEKENRKPLILRGARQVGKTTLVKKFSEEYKQSIYLNLEKEEDKELFTSKSDIKNIIETLFLKYNLTNDYQNTLTFIDEIQESSEAIHILRYFYEEYPEIHTIAAGSLLEFSIKDINSFPVGRVEFLYLSPLNFEEFLNAIGHSNALEYYNTIPHNPIAHNTLLNLYNTYVILGGMPEIIQAYSNTKSMIGLSNVYESLWSTYKMDIEKYGRNKTIKNVLKHIINTAQHSIDVRIKFNNFGKSDYKSREVGEAFRSLHDAKIIQIIYPTVNTEPPIQSDLKKSPRIQFLDTGLLNYSLGIQAELIGLKDLNNSYRGAIIPHMVNQEIIAQHSTESHTPSFWVREKNNTSSEVDLVFTHNNLLIPIEIKSGSAGSLKSLHQFIDRCPHNFGVRIYGGELTIEKHKTISGKEFNLLNLPYYLSGKISEYLDYFIKR